MTRTENAKFVCVLKAHCPVVGLVPLLAVAPADSACLVAEVQLEVVVMQQLLAVLPGSIQARYVERQYDDGFE